MLTAGVLGPYGCNREDLAGRGGRGQLPEMVAAGLLRAIQESERQSVLAP